MLLSNVGHGRADVDNEHWRKKNIGWDNWGIGRCTIGWVQLEEVYHGGKDQNKISLDSSKKAQIFLLRAMKACLRLT